MKAFDSYADQLDPTTGNKAKVAIVDIRTAAEHYWVGSPAMVTKIMTINAEEIIPMQGKVISINNGETLQYYQHQHLSAPQTIPISKVAKIETTDIATLIPFKDWDEASSSKVSNKNFAHEMQVLADNGINVVILMCRSGKRTSKATAAFDTTAFMAVYEIDQPDGKNGRGGFEGTSYHDNYNGYRGYPKRHTQTQKHPSVAWKDAGLPIHIGWTGK